MPVVEESHTLCDVLGFVMMLGLLSGSDIYSLNLVSELAHIVANPQNWGKLVCLISSIKELEKLEFLHRIYLRKQPTPTWIELEVQFNGFERPDGVLQRVGALGGLVQHLDLRDQYHIGTRDFGYLSSLTSLKSIFLNGCDNFTPESLRCLSRLSALENLSTRDCFRVNGHALTSLSSLHTLLTLDISGCENAMGGIIHLPKSITSLNLSRCDVSPGIVEQLAGMDLIELDLSINSNIVDNTAEALSIEMPNIRTLSLRLCSGITGQALKYIACLKFLQDLDLSFCELVVDGMEHLRSLTKLQKLNLCACNLTNEDVKCLAELVSLRELNLNQCEKIKDDCLLFLSELRSMQVLKLRNCRNITSRGVAYLVEMKALRRLDLSGCRAITDSDIAKLAEMKTLQHLDLSECNLTNACVAHLAKCANLKWLDLRRCHITSEALAHLDGLNLDTLHT